MNHLDEFSTLIGPPEAKPPLLIAAASIARYADRDYAPIDVVRQIRSWAAHLAGRVAADASAMNRLRMLNHYFFDELGFHPPESEDDRAENSYLHRVLARRTGIPISLSLVYIELGRQLGLGIEGVSFPGRFLVKVALSGRGVVVIDVYARGRFLSADELERRLQQAFDGGAPAPLARFLGAATEREILARMLRNLRAVHTRAEDWHAALEVQRLMVVLLPDAADERRERAVLFERLDCPRAAAEDVEAYLTLAPRPADTSSVRAWLAQLRAQARSLN